MPNWRQRICPVIRAADAAYKMGIGNAIVYFQDWQRADSDRTVRFHPFAMIYTPKGHKPGDAPITIYSDSAYVEFANRFDFQNAQRSEGHRRARWKGRCASPVTTTSRSTAGTFTSRKTR